MVDGDPDGFVGCNKGVRASFLGLSVSLGGWVWPWARGFVVVVVAAMIMAVEKWSWLISNLIDEGRKEN